MVNGKVVESGSYKYCQSMHFSKLLRKIYAKMAFVINFWEENGNHSFALAGYPTLEKCQPVSRH